MGLVYWSPMTDGTLKNQGTIPIQAPAAETSHYTSSVSGKLGKCIKTNFSNYIDTFIIGDWIGEKSNTFAGWFYFPYNEIKAIIDANTSTNTVPTGTLLGYCAYAGVALSWYSNKPMTKFWVMIVIRTGSNLYTAAYQLTEHDLMDKWVHLAGIWDNENLKLRFYVNGEQVSQINITSQEPVKQHLYINRNSVYGGNGPACCIPFYCNDLRVYKDEVLADQQIRWLAQALTLHYSLSNRGFGGDNLLMNSRSIATTGSDGTNKPIKTFDTTTHIGRIEYVATTGLQNAYTWITGSLGGASAITELTTGQKTYTYAIDVRVTNYTSGDITAYIDFRNDSGTPNINVGRLLTEDEKDGNWHRITATATSNNQQDTRSLFGFTNNSTPSGSLTVIEYKNPKLEAGSIATPWVPHSTDTLYSSLQLGSTTEFDLSGYQYNAIKNNISNNSDSPINKGCYVFNGTSSWVKCDTNAWMVQGATEFTASIWAYAEDWTTQTNAHLFSCTESGGFNTEVGASGYLRFPRYVYTNADKTSRAYQYSNNGIKLADLTPGWHMFTLIYTLTGEQIYIDGELHSSANYTSYGMSFNTNARLFLGCEAAGVSPSSPFFNGKLADYRFYYTALDEDAIKELYMMGGEA